MPKISNVFNTGIELHYTLMSAHIQCNYSTFNSCT